MSTLCTLCPSHPQQQVVRCQCCVVCISAIPVNRRCDVSVVWFVSQPSPATGGVMSVLCGLCLSHPRQQGGVMSASRFTTWPCPERMVLFLSLLPHFYFITTYRVIGDGNTGCLYTCSSD